MSFCLIILAGGNSHRFKSNIGKPYQKIAGKSLVEINVDKARKFKQIKKIVVVYNKKDSKRAKSLKLKNVKFILGGKNRQQSAFRALKYLINIKGISKVLIHDAARPNFSKKLLNAIIRNIKNFRAIIPKIDIQDAVKQRIDSSINEYIIGKNREDLFLTQMMWWLPISILATWLSPMPNLLLTGIALTELLICLVKLSNYLTVFIETL